jgi:flagellar basal body-associated protein FliL
MKDTSKPKTKEGVKKKMSGWLIALIVVVVVFVAGAICCNTIGRAQDKAQNPPQSTVEIQK